MGNRNTSSSNATLRSLGSLCDHVKHTLNIPSHVQTIYRTIYHRCGGQGIKLWDISRDAYFYNKRLRWMNDLLFNDIADHIGKVVGKAYNWLFSNNRLAFPLSNPPVIQRTVGNIRRVANYLESILCNTGTWYPSIRDPGKTYLQGYNVNKNGMVYDMISDHCKECRTKITSTVNRVKEEGYISSINLTLRNISCTNDGLNNQLTTITEGINMGLPISIQEELAESIRIYFETERNYLRGLDENGIQMNDSLRNWDYTAWFRKTGISNEVAATFLHNFSTQHIQAFENNASELRNDLSAGVNSLRCLARKIEILNQGNDICGDIPSSNADVLTNNDTLVISSMRPGNTGSQQQSNDDGTPVADVLVPHITTSSVGNFKIQSYQGLINKLLNEGLANDGYRMTVIAPPANAAAMAGTNANIHVNQQPIVDLFATLGGYNGHDFAYNGELAILIESDYAFTIDGVSSTIRAFLGIEPGDMDSMFNYDNTGYVAPVVDNDDPSNNVEEVPAIGPYYILLGPFDSNNNNIQTQLRAQRQDFYTNQVPDILTDVWAQLRYQVPVNNNQPAAAAATN